MESYPVNEASAAPNSRAEERPQEKLGAAILPDAAGEHDQDGPKGHGGRTFMEHARDAMDEHAEPGGILAQ